MLLGEAELDELHRHISGTATSGCKALQPFTDSVDERLFPLDANRQQVDSTVSLGLRRATTLWTGD